MYHILSLDGGGVRGYLTTSILHRIQTALQLQHQIQTDGVNKLSPNNKLSNEVGNMGTGTETGKKDSSDGGTKTEKSDSSGGKCEVGVEHIDNKRHAGTAKAVGKSPLEMRAFYEEYASSIFHENLWREVQELGCTLGSRYDPANLEAILTKHFGTLTLGDLKKSVMISGFDGGCLTGQWKPRFWSNLNKKDQPLKIVEVLLRATAAPTYFPIHKGYMDGGIMVNNPASMALIKALETKKCTLSNVRVLSVSTGSNPRHLNASDCNAAWGWAQWVSQDRLLDVMSDASSQLADIQCIQLLGQKKYLRIDPLLPVVVNLDNSSAASMKILKNTCDLLDIEPFVSWINDHYLTHNLADDDSYNTDHSDDGDWDGDGDEYDVKQNAVKGAIETEKATDKETAIAHHLRTVSRTSSGSLGVRNSFVEVSKVLDGGFEITGEDADPAPPSAAVGKSEGTSRTDGTQTDISPSSPRYCIIM